MEVDWLVLDVEVLLEVDEVLTLVDVEEVDVLLEVDVVNAPTGKIAVA